MAKRKRKERMMSVAVDHGTPERAQHDKIIVEETMTAGISRARVKHECRLDWYWDRSLLNDPQHDAGVRLRTDFLMGIASAGVTGAYEFLVPGDADFSEMQLRARERVRKALEKFGSSERGILVSVCAHDEWASQWERARGWPEKSGICLLRDALDDLARHYGLIK